MLARAAPRPAPPRRRRNKWARIAALQRNRDFIDDYRETRKAWLAGRAVTFPFGTYWLRRFANVPVAPPPGAPPATAGPATLAV